MHDVAWRGLWICVRSKDAQKQLARTSLNESYWAVLSRGTVYYAVQGGSNFLVCGWIPSVWSFKWKLLFSCILIGWIIYGKV